MKGLSTLVISMSTNLNVSAYNDILGDLILRHESKRNDDSVSVEELDWSNPS